MPPSLARRHARWSRPRPSGSAPVPPDTAAAGSLVNRLDRDRLYESLPYTIPLPSHLAELLHRLNSARALEPREVPPDLVTMNSVVRAVDAETGERQELALVYPYEADLRPMGTSITAPGGVALLGRRAGELVLWRTQHGVRVAVVESLLYQPEREGHYDR